MATMVKGTALHSTIRFITEKFGPEGLEKAMAVLSQEDQRTIRNGVLVSNWYPFATMVALMRNAKKELAPNNPDLYKEMGKASADFSLNTVYKIFFKVGSPQFIISRAATVYGNYYTSGEMKVTDSGKGFAFVDLTGFDEPCTEYCERIWGWMHRMLELTGAKTIHIVKSKCQCKGDEMCRFEGKWD